MADNKKGPVNPNPSPRPTPPPRRVYDERARDVPPAQYKPPVKPPKQ